MSGHGSTESPLGPSATSPVPVRRPHVSTVVEEQSPYNFPGVE
ncbi:MAG: hypothetical protein ACYDC2_08070 [Solirubrobacteraceae bacterium]